MSAEVQEAEALRHRLAALHSLVAAGDLDPADYAAATRELRTRLADVGRRITIATGKAATVALGRAGDRVQRRDFERLLTRERWQQPGEPLGQHRLDDSCLWTPQERNPYMELQTVTPKDEKGRRKHRYHQRVTTHVGYPKLREHLGSVLTIMKLSSAWTDFRSKLDRLHARVGDTMPLPFDDDSGRGF